MTVKHTGNIRHDGRIIIGEPKFNTFGCLPPISADTVYAAGPCSVLRDGAFLESWNDVSGNNNHMNTLDTLAYDPADVRRPQVSTTDPAFKPTCPHLNSAADHRSTAAIDMSASQIGNAIWIVIRTTYNPVDNKAGDFWRIRKTNTVIRDQYLRAFTFAGSPTIPRLGHHVNGTFGVGNGIVATPYIDGVPHFHEFLYNGSVTVWSINGIDVQTRATGMDGFDIDSKIHIGRADGGASLHSAFSTKLGMFMIDRSSSQITNARRDEVKAFAKEKLGCVNIS
jgi:hypothetical protein